MEISRHTTRHELFQLLFFIVQITVMAAIELSFFYVLLYVTLALCIHDNVCVSCGSICAHTRHIPNVLGENL